MKYLSLAVFTISALSLRSQDLIQNQFEKGQLINGKRVSLWEYYDENGDVELKLDYTTGKLVYLKPDSSDFVIYKNGSWVAQKLSVYPVPLQGYYNFQWELKAKIKYPAEARAIGSTGEVIVMFEVDTIGRSSDFRILKDIEGGCGRAVLSAVKEIDPLWIAAQVNRKSYRSRFLLRVIFSIEGLKIQEAYPQLPLARSLQPLMVNAIGIEVPSTSSTSRRRGVEMSAQNRFYNHGVAAFEQNKLEEADSLFTLSIKAGMSPDAIFNRAVTRRNMQDTCGYCRDLEAAIRFFSDREALKRYRTDCAPGADTVYYSPRYVRVGAGSSYRFYEVIRFDKCTKSLLGRIYDAKRTYQALTLSRDMGILNMSVIKTNVYGEYHLRDSIKVYTQFRQSPSAILKGNDRDLINNQLRQIILTKAPSLKDRGEIIVIVTCSGKNKITDVKLSLEQLLPAEVVDEIKDTLKIVLLNNFEYPEARFFDKVVLMDFYHRI